MQKHQGIGSAAWCGHSGLYSKLIFIIWVGSNESSQADYHALLEKATPAVIFRFLRILLEFLGLNPGNGGSVEICSCAKEALLGNPENMNFFAENRGIPRLH